MNSFLCILFASFLMSPAYGRSVAKRSLEDGSSAEKTSEKAFCNKGFCAKKCGHLFNWEAIPLWCYTMHDGKRQTCTNEQLDRCSLDQECGGPCDPFDWLPAKSKNIEVDSPLESLIPKSAVDEDDSLYFCHNGYCASYCANVVFYNFWCYIGPPNSQRKIPCSRGCEHWPCVSACTGI